VRQRVQLPEPGGRHDRTQLDVPGRDQAVPLRPLDLVDELHEPGGGQVRPQLPHGVVRQHGPVRIQLLNLHMPYSCSSKK
jgi:hypothetical protein